MAKLIDIWRTDQPVNLKKRQMPLIVDHQLTMIMDLSSLGYICESPLVRGKHLDEFTRKLNILTKDEIKGSFEVSHKDMLDILRQAVPCVGCRRSVERLFYDVMTSGHQALDPLIVTKDGMITLSDEVLESPRLLCTMLQGHSSRLNALLEKQPRSKKSRRCVLHSLEVQRTRPPSGAWREVWDVMKSPCRQELTVVEKETLETTLDTYLKKHRFCSECRTKVLLASSLLSKDPETIRDKGYVPALYAGIKRCVPESHVHLPTNSDYISSLIGRAQPEVMGRERHAKTLEIAQEEVLTCLGICVAEKLHRVHRRLREEETVCKVFAAVAIDALSRNFQMAVEVKQGITQLEILYEELTREEIVKEKKKEKLRLKRRKKKERKGEVIEKEEDELGKKENIPEPDCNCTETCSQKKIQPQIPDNPPRTCVPPKKSPKKPKASKSRKIPDSCAKNPKKLEVHIEDENCTCPKDLECTEELLKWIKLSKLSDNGSRASSEPSQSSQDCGYSSEHNASSVSMPSTPEGSEVACSEGCCGHEGDCQDNLGNDKLNHSISPLLLIREQKFTPTLTQMLQDSLSDDEGNESLIPLEEIQEFHSRVCQVHEKRLELRKNLRKRFAILCSHYKSSNGIPK
ncbi:gametogenetin-binding protein 2-like [Diachasma alloeum]|uniref:gametogenetin-binding protein 2-like n=1 Tax=Diachasma alloeum TaxID=454923 RepID=UPI0007383A72|nr:gametogenetin-binding protein 2-like [Diachasma alloeum]